jgi:MFS transporter, MHS family, proline/betaine transporter
MSVAEVQESILNPTTQKRQATNAMIASLLGWSLDLFDLFILLYVAPVLGTLFFPSSNATLSLAAVYASFAVTLLMRRSARRCSDIMPTCTAAKARC